MRPLLVFLAVLIFFATILWVPWWAILAVLGVGGLWLWSWDRVETRHQERIEPTESRRR